MNYRVQTHVKKCEYQRKKSGIYTDLYFSLLSTSLALSVLKQNVKKNPNKKITKRAISVLISTEFKGTCLVGKV